MSSLFGSRPFILRDTSEKNQLAVVQRPLRRVMAFRARTIDDIVNNPLVKREIASWYKLHKWVERGIDIHDLEDQWNP